MLYQNLSESGREVLACAGFLAKLVIKRDENMSIQGGIMHLQMSGRLESD